jgi:hypothetical protein
MTKIITDKFETMYDEYSPALYNIALQISPSQKHAERILVDTFAIAHRQNIAEQKYPSPYRALLQLVVQTTHQQLNNKAGFTNFKMEHFQKTPMIHQIICENHSLEDYCIENNLPKEMAMKKLRNEFANILVNRSTNKLG